MNTPSRSNFKGTKRALAEQQPCLEDAIRDLNDSTQVPECVKMAFNSLVKELSLVRQERDKLREENLALRMRLGISPNSDLTPSPLSSMSNDHVAHAPINKVDCGESERLRSVIISGIPEKSSSNIRERVLYDHRSVMNVLLHLNIECVPVAVYRLGRPSVDRSRLLKVVLPATYFQRMAVRRASRLRFFPEKGVFLRESLTDSERKRRREERTSRSDVVTCSY